MPDDRNAQFPPGTPETARESADLARALRRFLDAAAAMAPDAATTAALVRDLDTWTDRLAPAATSEAKSLWRKVRRNEPPALLPSLRFDEDGRTLDGRVVFGRFHVGRRAAHGGAVALVFDEAMRALSGSAGRTRGRTAYLHVDYRAVTPIDLELRVRAWFEREEGRKRFLRASIAHGDIVCAEAHGLWVELRPGQP